jgi:holo-[acyl-carrier protein] synthase
VGIDLVEIRRIRDLAQRFGERFLKRVFSESELAYSLSFNDPYPHLACRFAAKEALVKATGILETPFREISVETVKGAPALKVEGRLREDLLVSLSHTEDYAVAIVIKKGEGG